MSHIHLEDPGPQASYTTINGRPGAVRLGWFEHIEYNGEEIHEDWESCGRSSDEIAPDKPLPFPPEGSELYDYASDDMWFDTKAKAEQWLQIALDQVRALPAEHIV